MRRPAWRKPALGALAFVAAAALWQGFAQFALVNPILISSPSAVTAAFVDQLRSGVLARDVGTSAAEFAAGYALSAVVGVGIGVGMGWYRVLEYALDPLVWFGYSAPFIALYPLLVIFLGLGAPTVIAITFLVTVIPILVNTAAGIRNVDPKLVQAARSFGATDVQIFREVALPAAVPLVMAGLRLGVGRALVGVIIGELFGGVAGLGHGINYYGGLLQTDNMMVDVLMAAVLGIALTRAVSAVETRVDWWRGDAAGELG